ncbi:hypothetical protein MU748_24955 [Pseudomonas aeruginosa]|uniref:hypothetical protein n=1 Tax=Pseudomonas aeruginosa TaxID=287 RepID=UPI0024BE534B|nr:hypothetical protein [Pseudomonas aeruginosa]MDJ1412787.1 hypothetical protein [Pseudomonas aeruginosa]
MTNANECTCPSGDGSLRHPCQAHPAPVELAGVAATLTFINGRPAMCGCQVEYSSGGGEYSDVIYVTLCAKHSGSAILDLVATNRIALTPEYEGQWHADLYLDREIPLAKAEGATPAEAVLALMSAERIDPEQESVEQAGGDERAVDGKPRATKCPDCGKGDLMPGDLCACGYETDPAAGYACSECDGSGDGCVGEVCRECDGTGWFVTPEQARATLAQPSPKCATCNDSGQIVVSGPHYQGEFQPPEYETEPCDMCAQPSPAQAEQAEAERPEVVARVVHSNPVVLGQCGPLNANDELMTVAQHAASVARWAEMFNRVEQQRDAAMARVAELEAHCVRLGQGGAERYWENRWRDADARLQELEKQEPVATVAKVPGEDWNSLDFHRDLQDMQPGTKLYTAPVAQAQHSVPEISGIGRDAEHPRAVVLYLRNEPSEEDMRAIQNFLRAISADVLTQAQHSMPKAWLDVQAERRRQVEAEGWTPEHDDLYCAAELPRAAAAYILNGANDEAPAIWPFSAKWWKPRDARSNYVRAGALILAEIERLDRAAPGKEGNDD